MNRQFHFSAPRKRMGIKHPLKQLQIWTIKVTDNGRMKPEFADVTFNIVWSWQLCFYLLPPPKNKQTDFKIRNQYIHFHEKYQSSLDSVFLFFIQRPVHAMILFFITIELILSLAVTRMQRYVNRVLSNFDSHVISQGFSISSRLLLLVCFSDLQFDLESFLFVCLF